jgi:hypothetical protein
LELVNKKTGFGLLAKFADFGFPILTIPLLLSNLGAEGYASLVTSLSILAVCQVLINFGSEDLGQNDLLLGRPIASVLGEIIAMKAAIFIILFVLVSLFSVRSNDILISIFYVYLLAEIFNINFYFIYKDNVEYLLGTKIISKLIFLLIILFFDESFSQVVYAYIAQSLTFSALIGWHLLRTDGRKLRLTLNFSLIVRGYKLVLSNAASITRDKLPFFLLDPSVNSMLIVVLDLIQKVIIVFNSLIQTVVISNMEFWRMKNDLGLRHIALATALVSPLFFINQSFNLFDVVLEVKYAICCILASFFYFYSIYLAKFVYLINSRYNALVLISIIVMLASAVMFSLLPLHYLFAYFAIVYFMEMLIRAAGSHA